MPSRSGGGLLKAFARTFLKRHRRVTRQSAAQLSCADGHRGRAWFTMSDTEPGIRKLRAGKGFRYITPENRPPRALKKDEAHRESGDYPGYRRYVWISYEARRPFASKPAGRTRGRKQIRYHTKGARLRRQREVERRFPVASNCPSAAHRKRDSGLQGLTREKVWRSW